MEVNKYIEPIISSLLSDYNKVTHPDFDKDLREKTGIGWKQVKNYRSHPDPTSVLPKNSKVIKFVYKSRQQDKFFKLKRLILNISATCMLFAMAVMIYSNVRTDRENYEKKLNTLIEERLKQVMGIMGFNGCTKKTNDVVECPEGRYFFAPATQLENKPVIKK